MELSLDDFIRSQRKTDVGKGPPKWHQNKPVARKQLGDARNRIILKKRTRITDARDKLAELARQKDARVKLEQLRSKRHGVARNVNRNVPANFVNRNFKNKFRNNNIGLFSDSSRQVHMSPLMTDAYGNRMKPVTAISGYDMDTSMDEEYVPNPLQPIRRSINNDFAYYLPSSPAVHQTTPKKQHPLKDKLIVTDRKSFNLKIVAKNDVSMNSPEKPIWSDEPIYIRDDDSPSPVSILKKRSFGGKSDTSPVKGRVQPPVQNEGYRIVVSNLQSSVTASDIHELFGDIGKLVESRLVRPGTAEVIYSQLTDAQKAVDVYHNRQLDGQPMKCFLVNPRNPPANSDNLGSNRLGKPVLPASSNSSVVPDISTFHKVLFRKY